jgi:hypothetical protein
MFSIARKLQSVLLLLCVGAIFAAPTSARTKMNFNAGWRFTLGDPAGAAAPGYDDAAWQAIGLPHSFSIPYFQARSFYVGYGWYRKHLALKHVPDQRYNLEFEGAFQDAEVFVNGIAVGRHRGGYTGFSFDITKVLHAGDNLIAVRLNNKWDATLAPRAGEHVFSGGLYRDVWLVETKPVHVPWTGTRITTPNLTEKSGQVQAETEVRNDGDAPAQVVVQTAIVDDRGETVARMSDEQLTVAPRTTAIAKQVSAAIASPHLWSPETPTLYRVVTSLVVARHKTDTYETEFGFRWFAWTADKGFFLNGRHRYFKGANVHQDQAGWGDAVTNAAIDRDIQMMKDAGFDFIRGSHYPHDPHFAEVTDRIGMMFLSEAPFWGTAGFPNPWGASAYPTDPADFAAFDASAKQQLAEMIRINRNHPSIVDWGMDNEVFFSDAKVMPEVRRLLKEMVALSHQLDPTRPASIDGAQRGEIDHLGDIAAYNGDGAWLFSDPGLPNMVAEYGSPMEDRPGTYGPGWGDIANVKGKKNVVPEDWRYPWRSGEVIWCGFDHGSIAGRKFASMGLVDYARLPKRAWYWYRNAYRGIVPPEWPKDGVPAALRLTSSAPVIRRADGTDDVQLVVTVVDAAGKPISNSPPVTLLIVSGPGELPTGRSITFTPNGDIPIRDGKAAIAMRSWQAGKSRLVATSPGLKNGSLEIATLEGPRFVPGVTPLVAERPYVSYERVEAKPTLFGTNNPTGASSSADGHGPNLANDGDPASSWQPSVGDTAPWLMIDTERVVLFQRLLITFPSEGGYGFIAEVQNGESWDILAEQPAGAEMSRSRELPTKALKGRRVRVRLTPTKGLVPGVAEIRFLGIPQDS